MFGLESRFFYALSIVLFILNFLNSNRNNLFYTVKKFKLFREFVLENEII